ncbi:MAG: glycosyltransferase family 4 protein [Frankiales bacterium]|nr:glycosyltransferase family 4 protein [Frankiales bacterium]
MALALWQAFPGARLLTSVYDPAGTFPGFAEAVVETSWLQRVPTARRDPRRALPLMASAFDRLRVDDVDAVVCSSTGWAHGVATRAPKVVYCHNPARWLYQPQDYLRSQPAAVRTALRTLTPRLTGWDQRAAQSADRYLVNSTVVRQRVLATYGIKATVVPPPVSLDVTATQEAPAGVEPGFFLVVGRARGYKNTEAVCEAFAELPDQRLVVVGGLPSGDWPGNLTGLVDVRDAELAWLYAHCQALVSVAYEDFGLTPVEANAFGKPALVLRAGGFLDTLDEGVSGWFVESVEPAAVRKTVRQLLAAPLDPAPIREHAARYSPAAFATAVQDAVEQAVRPC